MRTRLTRTAAVSATIALGAVIAVSATTSAGSDGQAARGAVGAVPLEPSGSGCDAIPAEGAGSFAEMAIAPAGDAIASNADLSILSGAIETAGLVDTLDGEGPFTVLAPANSAFEMIPANVLDSILADSALLTELLGFHVIVGQALSSEALLAAGTVASSEGADLTFADDGGTVMVNGTAAVTCADIPVANGVIHIIDSVLQPPSSEPGGDSTSVPSSAPNVTAVATPGDGPQGPACAEIPAEGEGSFEVVAEQNALDAIAGIPMLSQTFEAIEAAGMAPTLRDGGPFTLFLPSNDAFAAVPAADVQAILADTDTLTSLLEYHIVDGEPLTAADLATLGEADTVEGDPLEFTAQADGSLTINGGEATVTCSNITVANGVIHIIGSVLVPPAG